MVEAIDGQRWVSFDPAPGSLLSVYLTQWKPSETFAPDMEWICVSRLKGNKKLDDNNIRALLSAWQALCQARMNIVNGEDLMYLATEHKVISSKWLLFVESKKVDEAWSIVATAVIDGLLGDDAKVSCSIPIPEPKKKKSKKEVSDVKFDKLKSKLEGEEKPFGCHVICVYPNDFNDLDSVFSIREALDSLGFKAKISFKPDAYSFCGVYSGNRWGIPPTIYCTKKTMLSVAKFQRRAIEKPGQNYAAWVTGFIGHPKGLGQEGLTYVGCSKLISPAGHVPWPCRKRVGKEAEGRPTEVLNHCHSHEGGCSEMDGGIHCYALIVTVADESGSLVVECWAPSMIVLGMHPSSWLGLDVAKREKILTGPMKPFDFQLMSIWTDGKLTAFKVHFVKPPSTVLADSEFGACISALKSLSVVDDKEEGARIGSSSKSVEELMFESAFVPSPFARMRDAIECLTVARDKHGEAIELLKSVVGDLPCAADFI